MKAFLFFILPPWGLSFIGFLFIRSFIGGIPMYMLNTSAYKKRKKRQSFKEWFLYSRYKEEIPEFFRFLYFFILFLYLACIVTDTLLYLIFLSKDGNFEVGRKIAKGIYYFLTFFNSICMVIISILFRSEKGREEYYAYERHIKKKRGQQKPKRK